LISACPVSPLRLAGSSSLVKQYYYISSGTWAILNSLHHLCLRPESAGKFGLGYQYHSSKGRTDVVTFSANQFNGRGNGNDDDVYHVGARLIAYQLLHAPETRFLNPGIGDTRRSKRRRLMDNGAIVVEVNHVHHNINISTMCEPRWMDTFTKWQDANVWPETSALRQGPVCGCRHRFHQTG
jgi:hypothetical protein